MTGSYRPSWCHQNSLAFAYHCPNLRPSQTPGSEMRTHSGPWGRGLNPKIFTSVWTQRRLQLTFKVDISRHIVVTNYVQMSSRPKPGGFQILQIIIQRIVILYCFFEDIYQYLQPYQRIFLLIFRTNSEKDDLARVQSKVLLQNIKNAWP
jgi:hypothetical protein